MLRQTAFLCNFFVLKPFYNIPNNLEIFDNTASKNNGKLILYVLPSSLFLHIVLKLEGMY